MSKSFGNFICCRDKRHAKQTPIQNDIKTVGKAKWLSLKTVHYTDFDGIEMEYDFVTRNKKTNNSPDMVIVIPILKSKFSSSIDTLLVEQYRPPIESHSCEMPNSFIGTEESPEDVALRELKEKTGYTGTIDTTFKAAELCMCPGLTDETAQMVVINVDLDVPINENPQPQLGEGTCSSIVTKRVPLTRGLKGLLGKSSGMAVSLLYSFAIGLEIGAKYL